MGATATVDRPSPAMLEDRWVGLMEQGLNPSDLQNDLDRILTRIVEGMLRRSTNDLNGDRDGKLIDELEKAIRDRILEYGEREAMAW